MSEAAYAERTLKRKQKREREKERNRQAKVPQKEDGEIAGLPQGINMKKKPKKKGTGDPRVWKGEKPTRWAPPEGWEQYHTDKDNIRAQIRQQQKIA